MGGCVAVKNLNGPKSQEDHMHLEGSVHAQET